MAVKITVNNSEIKNPVIQFIVTLVFLFIFFVLFIIVFFLLFPLLWVLLASAMLLSIVLLFSAKKLRAQYKVIVIEKGKIEQQKHRIP